MADYSEAKYRHDTLVAQERSENMNETNERRITTNNQFYAGGYVAPSGGLTTLTIPTTNVQVKHIASFESAGEEFTVAELRAALSKLNVSASATISFEPVSGEGEVNDVTLATVEWVS